MSGNVVSVIGDIILDQVTEVVQQRNVYSEGTDVYNCPLGHSQFYLGGAGNVAANVRSLGGSVELYGCVGESAHSSKIAKLLESFAGRISTCTSPLIEKHRLFKDGQLLFRIDSDSGVTPEATLINRLEDIYHSTNAVVVADYNKGTIDEDFAKALLEYHSNNSYRNNTILILDVRPAAIHKYDYFDSLPKNVLLKSTRQEAIEILNDLAPLNLRENTNVKDVAKHLFDITNTPVVITDAQNGAVYCDSPIDTLVCPPPDVEAVDPVGAGDTFLAAIATYIPKLPLDLMYLNSAVVAASIATTKLGTYAVKAEEVLDMVFSSAEKKWVNKDITEITTTTRTRVPKDYYSKIVDIDALLELKDDWQGKRVGFTNGCFDVLHLGHVNYLRSAASAADILVVGINSDKSIKSLGKGDVRPIHDQQSRAYLLTHFEFIDYVIIFDEETPEDLLRQLKPDVLLKGGNYSPGEIVGADIVTGYGGEVALTNVWRQFSTSSILDKLSDARS